MSTVGAYRDFEAVRSRIGAIRARWRSFLVLRGALALGLLLMGLVLLVALLEGLIHLPVLGRVLLLGVCAVCLLVALVVWVARPALRRLTDEEVARHIECAVPEIRNDLINAVQLARDRLCPSKELVDAAITESATESVRHDLRVAISALVLLRLAVASAALVAAIFLFSLVFPGRLSNALMRVLRPTDTSLPVAGSVTILEMTPGESPVVVLYGEALEVKVRFRAPDPASVKGVMVWEYATGEKREAEMAVAGVADVAHPPSGEVSSVQQESHPGAGVLHEAESHPGAGVPHGFVYRFPSVDVPLRYHVRLGDTESARFDVEIRQKPEVSSVDLEYRYPRYTALAAKKELDSKTGAIEAPVGSEVKIRAHVSRPVIGGKLRFSGDAPDVPLSLPDAEVARGAKQGLVVEGSIYVLGDRKYSFYLVDPSDRASAETGERTIRAVPDARPVAEILSPALNVTASPGDTVKIVVRVGDDYAVTKVALFLKRRESEASKDEPAAEIASWTTFDNPKADTVGYALELKPGAFQPGDVLAVWAQVWDSYELGDRAEWHQSSTSPERLITLRSREEAARQLTEDLRSWKDRIEEILHTQQRARAAASTLDPAMPRADFVNRADSVAKDQLDVYQKTFALSDDMKKLEGESARLACAKLTGLARKEMPRAVQLAGAVAKLDKMTDLPAGRDDLLEVQDKIITALKQVLDILPGIEKEALGEKPGDAATEMPQDPRKQWKDLAEKLKEFADQQKKIVADSNDLAKKPVDDFTEADKDRLKELAAVEDEWSKYMKEMHKDLSTLPNQDFSNPSLLKELLAVQEDVQKAADALTRKAVEMAVPLEQSGVENAKELTTHIEKWLPDSADRDQWKMEEPVEDLETPMAELPKELEDIVGDLMENEEDLFEEVEDASSAWADSIDKGAGWDAMDGPISNMSAQGVTGNRLPNSSEIGGRSGEGREGKSGGEMVGDEAVGKGGRRTPTRLTPDPYEAGEVKDSSKDSAGGSTGGGKVSGASKEGLEGPVPPPLARKMERLAGKQADIRNTAERVNVAFKVLKYPTGGTERLVSDMKSVEDDLKNYRYENVLRKKRVMLKGLEAARLMAGRRVTVGRDASASLPPEVQQEILDTAENDLPPEFRDLVQKYYESLSEK